MISNIDQIKAASDLLEIASETITLKPSGTSQVGKCPFHADNKPSFSIKANRWTCFGCDKGGDVIDFIQERDNLNYIEAIKYLAERYNIELEEETKDYDRPIERLTKVSPSAMQYFEGRGISNNTLLRFKITQAQEWMPEPKAEVGVICFNYYRDGELVNIKFRSREKGFKMAKNAELIFYNLDQIKDETECVIVEGEIDCLSLHEAGIYNSVSVPNGASATNLKYVDNCWQHFEGMIKIVLLTDKDQPGRKLAEELSRRLGRDRCYQCTFPEECKDANDVLTKYGKETLRQVVASAKLWPIEGVLGMDDLYPTIEDYYINGFPKACEAGIGEFDKLLTFTGGQMTTVTGSPGSGKSEFIDYISTSLARRHLWKFAVCSFENPPALHATKLMEKFIGLSFAHRKDTAQRMDREQFNHGVALTDQYFDFINISQADITVTGLINKLSELVRRKGIKAAIIDPWNYIEHKIPMGYSETQYISEALTQLKEFAVTHDVHLFIVAHPKKLVKDQKGKFPVANMYDISGSAHFFNKTDNGISVHRDFDTGVVDVYVQKVRFSWQGQVGFTSYNFDTFTRQYKSI